MADPVMVVGFALFGPPMARKGTLAGFPNLQPFQAFSYRLSAAYTEDVFETGHWYEDRVRESFERKHGRTGRTAKSISNRWTPGKSFEDAAVYSISIAGGVGFVINPIPEHEIPASRAGALFSAMRGPFKGRETNFYSEFGPVRSVSWNQRGAESHSPDRSWYQDLESAVEVEGQSRLNRLAGFSSHLWGEMSEPPTLLAASEKTIE